MEIKFRGINHETGEFVYGWYTKLCKGARKYDAIISDIDGSLVEFYIHDSKSIGQFTGLKDKNGVEIYEGDILSLAFYDEFNNECVSIDDNSHRCNVKVYWDNDGYWLFSEADATWFFPASLDDSATIELIGNIHQNPELLNA